MAYGAITRSIGFREQGDWNIGMTSQPVCEVSGTCLIEDIPGKHALQEYSEGVRALRRSQSFLNIQHI